jgi:hypothetical protein
MVDGKTNTGGIRLSRDPRRMEVAGAASTADHRDKVQAHGLSCPVKYMCLRRKLLVRNSFYTQRAGQGTPFQKTKHQLDSGIVGLDLVPCALVVVSERAALPRGGSRC